LYFQPQVAIQLNLEDGFVMPVEKPKKGSTEATAAPAAEAKEAEEAAGRGRAKKKKDNSSSSKSRSKSTEGRSSSKGSRSRAKAASANDGRELNLDGRQKHATAAQDAALASCAAPVPLAALEQTLEAYAARLCAAGDATGTRHSLLHGPPERAAPRGYGSAGKAAQGHDQAAASGMVVSDEDEDGGASSDEEGETSAGGKRKLALVAAGASGATAVVSMDEDVQTDSP
jgi:hypothetical protein